jgi:hypothetical protein
MMVIGHDGDQVQLYDPATSATFWSTLDQLSLEQLGRGGIVTGDGEKPSTPHQIYLPAGT